MFKAFLQVITSLFSKINKSLSYHLQQEAIKLSTSNVALTINNLLKRKNVFTATTPDLSLNVVDTCSLQYSSI